MFLLRQTEKLGLCITAVQKTPTGKRFARYTLSRSTAHLCNAIAEKHVDLKVISNALGHSKSIISMDVYGDNQHIIADGVKEIIPFIREITPEDVLVYLEEGREKQHVNFESDICFPNDFADEIMQDVLNNRTSCGKDN